MLIGFIVNPIAGMGGRVGLKGTDGEDILAEAKARGAKSWSPERARETLTSLRDSQGKIKWLTWSGEMGESLLLSMDFEYEVIGSSSMDITTPDDTKAAAREMEMKNVDLILFAGGDGTASDIIEVINMRVPILGIPAGVKMFSAVFASTPKAAAQIIWSFLEGDVHIMEREVMDIDEEAYRSGNLSVSLKGYAIVPCSSMVVLNGKSVTSSVDEELAKEAVASRVVEEMHPGAVYVLGPGSTVAKVAEVLGVEKTLLGIDVVKDGKLILRDADENGLLNAVGDDAWIVLSPLGGQGALIGRGNQPISPKILTKVGLERIIVIATPIKIQNLKALTVDTGDADLNERLRGFKRVIIGYHEEKVMRVI